MKRLVFISLATCLVTLKCNGYDILQGAAAQSKPCFGTIPDEFCNTDLAEALNTSYKPALKKRPDTHVFLFTMKNQQKAEELHKCGGKLPPKSNYDSDADTVILIHGYIDGTCRTAWMREMRNQFFIRGNYNVILVDYTWGQTLDLGVAEGNALVVAEQIAFVIKNIMLEKNLDGNKFHLIGQSLGCLIVSYIGRFITEWDESKKLRRITHLDFPSVPLRFGLKNGSESRKVAKFVDLYHTNAGDCIPILIGTFKSLGHLDFFPNGGVVEVSAMSYGFESVLKGDVFYGFGSILYPQLGFHIQSIQFFKRSINPPDGLPYVGVRCYNYEDFQSGACQRCCKEDFSNCVVAGMDAEYYYTPSKTPDNHTKYFFNTYDHCPFPEDYEFSIFKNCKRRKKKSKEVCKQSEIKSMLSRAQVI